MQPVLVSETRIFRPNSCVVLGAVGTELEGKGGRAAGPLADEEKKIRDDRVPLGFLLYRFAWAGPTAAGEDPSVWGRGKWKGFAGREGGV